MMKSTKKQHKLPVSTPKTASPPVESVDILTSIRPAKTRRAQRVASLPALAPARGIAWNKVGAKDSSPAFARSAAMLPEVETTSSTHAGLLRRTGSKGVTQSTEGSKDRSASKLPGTPERRDARTFTEPVISELELNLARRDSQGMKDVLRIQKETMIPLDSFQFAMKLFAEHADTLHDEHFKDGFLSKEGLGKILQKMAPLDADSEKKRVSDAFTLADKDADGRLSFKEFLIWFSSRLFQEEFSVDSEEQPLRRMSRVTGIPLVDLDTYKRKFDKFDLDASGKIDRHEFYEMLLLCLKLPRHIGMPSKRVHQLWSAADVDMSGEIDFEEFVTFYYKYFCVAGGDSCIDHLYRS